MMTGVVSAAFNLHTPTVQGKEYALGVTHAAGWSVGVLYRVEDARLYLNVSF